MNHKIETYLSSKTMLQNRITPDYNGYCFSNIPSTILNHFNLDTDRHKIPDESFKEHIEDSEKLVILLIDGLGYTSCLQNIHNTGFIKKICEKGSMIPLTSVFPSTTAASMNTLSSGLTPQEHGLPEWYVYFKELDMILESLPFKKLDGVKGKLFDIAKADPRILYKNDTIYQRLGERGVKSYTIVPEEFVNSPYSDLTAIGSTRMSYSSLRGLFVTIRKLIEYEKDPAFIYAYIGSLDTVGHEKGPGSKEYSDELNRIDTILSEEMSKIKVKKTRDTSLIIVSDHGQIDSQPEETVYLNNLPKLRQMLRKSSNMGYIAPTGAPRDVYLHLEKEKVDDCYDYLQRKLDGVADVFHIPDVVELGLFGLGTPSKEFLERVGDLLILPKGNNTVWYQVTPGQLYQMRGIHGGLSKKEVMIPLAVTKIEEL